MGCPPILCIPRPVIIFVQTRFRAAEIKSEQKLHDKYKYTYDYEHVSSIVENDFVFIFIY